MGDYNAGGRQVGSQAPTTVSDFDRDNADIPIWGWLSGASGRRDAARARDEANTNQSYWNSLNPPTQDQLMGPQDSRDAQSRALAQMQQWSSGDLTATDRGALEASRQRDAQASGSQQRSLMQQAQARGVGGSGLDYATRQQAAQQAQQQASDQESAVMQGAQARGLQANAQAGELASSMRRSGMDATQQAYQDAATRAAGATGQYGTDASGSLARSGRDQQRDQGLLGMLGEIIG